MNCTHSFYKQIRLFTPDDMYVLKINKNPMVHVAVPTHNKLNASRREIVASYHIYQRKSRTTTHRLVMETLATSRAKKKMRTRKYHLIR